MTGLVEEEHLGIKNRTVPISENRVCERKWAFKNTVNSNQYNHLREFLLEPV